MVEDRAEFRPFGVDSRARHYRVAFLVNPEACPPELLDSLFDKNYGLWGGRFNPIIPVRAGEIDEAYWALLRFVDPDLIYTYTPLGQSTIDRIERELVPWQIHGHPPHLAGPAPPAHYPPASLQELVSSRQVLPLLMGRSGFGFPGLPTLLTYFQDGKSPLNQDLVKLIARNFGIIRENSFPALAEEWTRLQVQNRWTPQELFHGIAHTPNLLFPFQASAAHSVPPPRGENGQEEYCLLVGDNAETWLYFWNRIFLVKEYLRSGWNTLCLPPSLLEDENFVGPLREFLKRYALRSGSSPSRLTLQSFECSEDELSAWRERILNGIDVIRGSKKLLSGNFPTVSANRPEIYIGWGPLVTTHQQATSRESLLSPPRSRVPIEQGVWVMDLRVQYLPKFAFYANEVLSWKLPRRLGVAEGFFPQASCRIDADYSLSVEMRLFGPFMLRIPDENEIFHRAAGVTELRSYDASLNVNLVEPKFHRMGAWDKALYLNGILELFEGLQSAGRFFEHSYWRGVFERMSHGAPKKETGLFETVRNKLNKKKSWIASQLASDHPKPIDWLSHLVIRLARDLQLREEDVSFLQLQETFLEQRERFILSNPDFRKGASAEELEQDRKAATADLAGILQMLTDSGVLQQGIRVRCPNCGSRLWREMGTLQQKVKCEGCNSMAPVPVESKWHYRLNSLVRNGIALHGCVPVISALHNLRQRARQSFIYTHGVALYRKYTDKLPEVEIDLLCISDGKLVCGEVKSSASEFTREELAKLAGIATDIKADQVAISAFNDPDGLMGKHAQALGSLLPVGCTVTICGPNEWAFRPQPHAL